MLGNPRGGVDAVLIGASAGAVVALGTLLPLLPADLGVPVLIVVHLPPRQRSLLAEIFKGRCALEVCEALDKQPLRAGVLYFAPPDYHLLVEGDALALSNEEPVQYSRPSIDVLFESAVEVFGGRLLALVLSGANQDGAAGAAAVRAAGGIVAVQDPRTAEAAMMPVVAIERSDPQFVGTLAELASFLIRTVRGQAMT
jgi:two-component system chemotaxis response regulator CheB